MNQISPVFLCYIRSDWSFEGDTKEVSPIRHPLGANEVWVCYERNTKPHLTIMRLTPSLKPNRGFQQK